jgi:hypothetical protein
MFLFASILFLSFYPPLSSFLSLLPFRQANVSIRFNFISVFLSTFIIISLSIVFSSGQCFYSLQFYLCLSKTRMELGGKQRCKIYISFTINFQHFKTQNLMFYFQHKLKISTENENQKLTNSKKKLRVSCWYLPFSCFGSIFFL